MRTGLVAVLTLLALILHGCIKVRLTVKLNEDGSGQVIEEIIFGEKLVNVSKRMQGVPTIDELTGDGRVRERMAKMGEGVSLVSRQVETLPDGSVRMVVVYAYQDISHLRLAPLPFGAGWEDVYLDFDLEAERAINLAYDFRIAMRNFPAARGQVPVTDLLSEREAQQVRRLLPVFKDLLQGFELSLKMEVYEYTQWASAVKGHSKSMHVNELSQYGGRLMLYQVTDEHLAASDDGLLLVVPWRQVGREFDLYHHHWPPGPRILPHVNRIYGSEFRLGWRAIQTPRGREYY